MNVHDISRKNALKILDWCYQEYGCSKYTREYVRIYLYKTSKTKLNIYGEYDWDEKVIRVYADMHKSFKEFAGTIIHEYQHYLQNEDLYMLYSKRGYKNNYYEIRAESISSRDKRRCIKETFIRNSYDSNKKQQRRIVS